MTPRRCAVTCNPQLFSWFTMLCGSAEVGSTEAESSEVGSSDVEVVVAFGSPDFTNVRLILILDLVKN